MQGSKVLALVVLALAALTGCTPSADSASSSSAAAPGAGTTSTAPSSGPATSAPPAVGIATWTIDGQGVGPVRLGMPAADAVATASPYQLQEIAGCTNTNVRFLESAGAPAIALGLDDAGVVRFAALAGNGEAAVPPLTSKGVGIGSSGDEMRAAYPALEPVANRPPGDEAYAVRDGGGWISFSLSPEGRVRQIVSAATILAPKEFCG